MAESRRLETDELSRKALDDLWSPSDFTITREERLLMRNIPFFLLPQHETLPNTDHVLARVDTRNKSYSPSHPKPLPVVNTPIPDYSQVKSRINTGRLRTSSEHPSTTTQRLRPKTYYSTPSLHHTAPVLTNQRAVSGSQLTPRPFSVSKYKDIRSKVNSQYKSLESSCARTTHPKASHKEVKDTVDNKEVSKSSKDQPTPTLAKSSRIPVPKKVVRSKIDNSDPNPAHKLKHTLEQLTFSYGPIINPRFSENKDKSKISRRFSSSQTEVKVQQTGPKRRTTIDTPLQTNTDSNFIRELELTKTMDSCSEENRSEVFNGGSILLEDDTAVIEGDMTICDIEVNNTETDTTVFLKHILSKSSLIAHGPLNDIQDNGDEVGYYEGEDEEPLLVLNYDLLSHDVPKLCVIDENGDLLEVIVDPPQRSHDQLKSQVIDDNLSEMMNEKFIDFASTRL